MARTITEIHADITNILVTEFAAIDITINPAGWSKTNLLRLFTYIIAVCQWTIEQLQDAHKAEVNEIIATKKPHSLRWYAEKAKAFQFGDNLVPEEDFYDNTGVAESVVEASRVVKYAAVVRQKRANGRVFLRIKAATTSGADLTRLEDDQLDALREYFSRIADAGVDVEVDSQNADRLQLKLKIFYNPLILGANGSRLDGTDSAPVPNAIRAYLKNLPFNGLFVLAHLVDALQVVEGVEIPHLIECQTSYAQFPPASVDVEYVPDSGYLRIDDADLNIEYIPHSQIK
ncbi:nucleotidyltransferase [Niastella caeni]|uniref:Nucleotidyltransferase n=1 Tax=Niastella caeni TaxID=2569763 RepID=A0A4S8HNR7_9BACT|nr:nucleotidyltransferase [Niastella caeni]THU36923.1 nucleotidyltransferase [Niastella caeni]